jgi:regulator of cell morphogenesis and NO signaling
MATARTANPEPCSDLDPSSMVQHIETVHHRYLWDELPRLGVLVDEVLAAHGQRHPELGRVGECFAALRADLEPHLLKEERVLFPSIGELVLASSRPTFHCGRISNPISVMMLEHDRADELLAQLATTTDNYRAPADACASYQALYDGLAQLDADVHSHIHEENNVLFPAVVRLEQHVSQCAPEHSP